MKKKIIGLLILFIVANVVTIAFSTAGIGGLNISRFESDQKGFPVSFLGTGNAQCHLGGGGFPPLPSWDQCAGFEILPYLLSLIFWFIVVYLIVKIYKKLKKKPA